MALSPARAQAPATPAPPVKETLARFEALAAAAGRRGDLPRLSDPTAAAVLRALWGATANPSGAEPDDIAALGEIESSELAVLSRYKFFPGVSSISVDWNRVAAQFPDELSGAFVASIAAVSNGSKVLERTGPSLGLPESLAMAGLVRELRQPALGLFIDAQNFVEVSQARPASIAQVGRAFADHAQDYALILPQSDRKALAAALRPTVDKLSGSAREPFETFISALTSAPCGVLCNVP